MFERYFGSAFLQANAGKEFTQFFTHLLSPSVAHFILGLLFELSILPYPYSSLTTEGSRSRKTFVCSFVRGFF